ncbi:hypothetical protein TSUD_321420 [Trifolium subterraneum]|uniref:Uncharacterized protein n=1 Tax=Trifolium subterraneum TaxID=3900 RepID=A0A2Z6N5Q1_TRISU|nr:hypothetical protein TSUD_321420 [Trifolium subterraneum]
MSDLFGSGKGRCAVEFVCIVGSGKDSKPLHRLLSPSLCSQNRWEWMCQGREEEDENGYKNFQAEIP